MIRRDDILDQLLVETLAGRPQAGKEPDLQALADIVAAKVRGNLDEAMLDGLNLEEQFLVDTAAEAEKQWLDLRASEQSAGTESLGNRFQAMLLWAKEGIEFVWGTLSPLPLAPAAAVRSGAGSGERSYCAFQAQTDAGIVEMAIERRPTQGFDLQVSAPSRTSSAGWRATILRKGRLVESAPLDGGRVCFTGLFPDTYQVTLSAAGETLAEFDLNFVTD